MDVTRIIDEISAYVPADDNTYDVDGVKYCSLCNTPREHEISLMGMKRLVPIMCDCKKKLYAEEKARTENEKQKAYVEQLRSVCFGGSEYRNATFDSDDKADEENSKVFRNYAEHFWEFFDAGKGLFVIGTTGCGKTFLASCVLNYLIDRGTPALFTSISDIESGYLSCDFAEKSSYIESFNKYRLIVIDDFGVERRTEYVNQIREEFINERYKMKLPIIFTSNITAEDFRRADTLDDLRAFSRIKERCIPINMKGSDRREQIGKKEREHFMNILRG